MAKLEVLSCFILLLIVVTTYSCNDGEKFKFAIIQFSHETCTFCPGGDTTIEDWSKRVPFVTGEQLLKSGGYTGGFVHQASLFDDVELIGINSPDRVFGGSSRSWNTKKSFEHFMKIILDDLKSKLPVDAVQLSLHGAMATRDVPRPEAEIAKRVRELVGPDIPISGTFDLHGNEDSEFLKWANAAFVTKRFPHYDAPLQGERSANFLYRSVKNKFKSTTATRKPGILTATVLQWTGAEPASTIMERARRWENRNKDVFVSVFFGFPWSDVPDIGATIHVVTNNNQQLADSIADDMNDYFLRVKKEFAGGSFLVPKEAVKKTKMAYKQKGWSAFTKKNDDKKVNSTIDPKHAKGINIENISAVQNKGGKNFVVEVGDNEYYDPSEKDFIGGKSGKWEGNYNDWNNKRDTMLVNPSYKVGDLIDETDWETGKATKKAKK